MGAGRHAHDLQAFTHTHAFAGAGQQRRERALSWVTLITLVTMVAELAAGWWTGSLALTADGWHMGTHALALGGAVLAYRWSQRAANQRGHGAGAQGARVGAPAGFAFGGWKIEVLAAYTSGLVLLGVAAWLAWEGVSALRAPRAVIYQDALVVAVIGLVVNLASVWLLAQGGRGHDGHPHPRAGHHPSADAQHRAHPVGGRSVAAVGCLDCGTGCSSEYGRSTPGLAA